MADVHGYLLILCIVIFTMAVATLFLAGYKVKEEPKKFDKQGVVKYRDNDY